jgi:hypothetical protein
MPKKDVVKLTADERSKLDVLVRKGDVAGWKIQRAQELLKRDAGPAGAGWRSGASRSPTLAPGLDSAAARAAGTTTPASENSDSRPDLDARMRAKRRSQLQGDTPIRPHAMAQS